MDVQTGPNPQPRTRPQRPPRKNPPPQKRTWHGAQAQPAASHNQQSYETEYPEIHPLGESHHLATCAATPYQQAYHPYGPPRQAPHPQEGERPEYGPYPQEYYGVIERRWSEEAGYETRWHERWIDSEEAHPTQHAEHTQTWQEAEHPQESSSQYPKPAAEYDRRYDAKPNPTLTNRQEKRIIDSMMHQYDKLTRSAANHDDPEKVHELAEKLMQKFRSRKPVASI